MERREMRLQRSPKEAAGGEDRHGGVEGKHVRSSAGTDVD